MANLVTFNNVLIQRCGIGRAQLCAAVADDRYDEMEAFLTLNDREIDSSLSKLLINCLKSMVMLRKLLTPQLFA